MRKQPILVLAVAIILVFLTNTGFAEILPYEITDLGPGEAWGINDAGQVVGYSSGYAFLWDSTDGMIDLGALGGFESTAYGINDAGQVVGYSGSDYVSGFIWDSTNGMRYLDGIGDNESWARDINNSGQVVVWTFNYSFLWDSTSGVTDLGAALSAYGINDAGQVVGQEYFNGQSHPFLWDDGDTIELGTLGGSGGRAYDINNSGQVVGYADLAGGDEHAFLWEDGEMIDLGTLGGPYSSAHGINNEGQVVGYLFTSGEGYSGFLWDSENGMIELSDLLFDDSGWDRLTYAMDINNYGQIVGWGSIDSETHAFLMTPVPEPATLLLVALGSLALLRKRKP